ncbi:Protein of unknown function [Bacillus thuringiensis]|uniref:Uncharacterized protein n=1 Tax=Bacillus thuringiensis TaxID=1428 RepID=A0A1C4CKU5_BACTU|nr:Protein of unknown function [Bacillus thuringiensis]
MDLLSEYCLNIFGVIRGKYKKLTDGALIHFDHEDVRIPAGGSKQVASYDTVENRQHYY